MYPMYPTYPMRCFVAPQVQVSSESGEIYQPFYNLTTTLLHKRSLVKCGIAECGKQNVESKNAEMSAEWWVKRGMRKGQFAR